MSSILPFNVLRYTSLPSAAVDYVSPVAVRIVSGILQRVITDLCCSFVLNILWTNLANSWQPTVCQQSHYKDMGNGKLCYLVVYGTLILVFCFLLSAPSSSSFSYFLHAYVTISIPEDLVRYGNSDTSNVLTSDGYKRVQLCCFDAKKLWHILRTVATPFPFLSNEPRWEEHTYFSTSFLIDD